MGASLIKKEVRLVDMVKVAHMASGAGTMAGRLQERWRSGS